MSIHDKLKLVSLYFATTTGRDKFYRSIQYFCRFLAQHTTDELQFKLKSIVSNASTTRKWLRLVRLDFFNPLFEEVESPKKYQDPVVHYLTILRNISMQFFFYCDHAILFHSLKLYSPSKETFKNIKEYQMKFWAIGLVLAIVKQLHISGIYPQKQQSLTSKLLSKRTLLMDFLDLLIPLTSLGYLNLTESHVGIFGTITALNGAYEVSRKLK